MAMVGWDEAWRNRWYASAGQNAPSADTCVTIGRGQNFAFVN
jgi:hypothetical protein